MPAELLNNLGVSKVMTISCTYDHRVIQGAESGMFLARVQDLLEGEDNFYEADLRRSSRTVPAGRWEIDKRGS